MSGQPSPPTSFFSPKIKSCLQNRFMVRKEFGACQHCAEALGESTGWNNQVVSLVFLFTLCSAHKCLWDLFPSMICSGKLQVHLEMAQRFFLHAIRSANKSISQDLSNYQTTVSPPLAADTTAMVGISHGLCRAAKESQMEMVLAACGSAASPKWGVSWRWTCKSLLLCASQEAVWLSGRAGTSSGLSSVFHTPGIYLASSYHVTERISPPGRTRSFQSSLEFPRGCQRCALSRCTPSCWAGQYRIGHLQGREKHFAQLEAAKQCKSRTKLTSMQLCSQGHQPNVHVPPISKPWYCHQPAKPGWDPASTGAMEARLPYRSATGTTASGVL